MTADPIPPDLDDPDTDPGTAFDAEVELRSRPPSEGTRQLMSIDPHRPGPPWAGLIFLLLYLIGCVSAIWTSHVTSDTYITAGKMKDARAFMGDDQGRDRETPDLAQAAQIYLNVLLIDPDFKAAHDQLEAIRWRYQERKEAFPTELARQQAMVSAKSTLGKTEGGLFGSMPVTAEKRFNLKALKAKAITRLVWTGVGALAIFGWVIFSHQRNKREQMARIRKARAEIDKGSALY